VHQNKLSAAKYLIGLSTPTKDWLTNQVAMFVILNNGIEFALLTYYAAVLIFLVVVANIAVVDYFVASQMLK